MKLSDAQVITSETIADVEEIQITQLNITTKKINQGSKLYCQDDCACENNN